MSDTSYEHSPASASALAVRDPWALVPSARQPRRLHLGRQPRSAADPGGRNRVRAGACARTATSQAAGSLVLSHLRLVVSISRKYLGYGLPHGDLIQEGNVGLMKAVKRFDPDQGVRLVSYAMHWIKAEIHEYILKNWRMVKVATTKAQRKLFFNLRSMKQSLKDDAADERHPSRDADARARSTRWPRAERQARGSARDGNPPLGRRRRARAADRRRRGKLRADRLPGRRQQRADPGARGAQPRLAGRRRHRPGARRARRAQPPHRRRALAEGQRRQLGRHDAARPGRRVRRQRRAHPPDRGGGDEEDAQGAGSRRAERRAHRQRPRKGPFHFSEPFAAGRAGRPCKRLRGRRRAPSAPLP